jgi:HNH endonuclease
MPYGTAGHRLRKLIMFHLLERHGENVCFKCQKTIDAPEELSIEHIRPWQLAGSHFYWDMDNIAFSHLKCNRQSISKPGSGIKRRKVGPEGTAWCSRCKDFLPVERFYKNRSNWNGYSNRCISCAKGPSNK